MSIFGTIMDKIFHHPAAEPAAAPTPAAAPETASAVAPQPAQATPAAAQQPVDVEAVLTTMAEEKGGGGNWDTSIVDLLKLLDLDSSLEARKALAGELNVHVAADGSAEENTALHKAVMQKLVENGGKAPAGLS